MQYTLSLSTKSFDSNYFMYSDALDGTYAKVSSSNTLYGELGKEIYVAFHLGSSKFKGWLTAENGMTISDFGACTFEKTSTSGKTSTLTARVNASWFINTFSERIPFLPFTQTTSACGALR